MLNISLPVINSVAMDLYDIIVWCVCVLCCVVCCVVLCCVVWCVVLCCVGCVCCRRESGIRDLMGEIEKQEQAAEDIISEMVSLVRCV